jgi:antitoxin VapB
VEDAERSVGCKCVTPDQSHGLVVKLTTGYADIQIFSAKPNLMPLNIKDPAAEKLVRELAAATGESVTTAVRRAAEERLQRVRRQRAGRSLAAEILEIGRRCAALPDLDVRTADEIIGYDEHGLPR